MDTDYPLSAKRLYALIGEKISEFPPYFIERLERKLEASEQSRTRSAEVVYLHLVPPVRKDAPLRSPDDGVEPNPLRDATAHVRTLQAVAVVLEILDAVHATRPEDHPEARITDDAVEGLIICGREMIKSVTAGMESTQ
ncbi:hypothetical protein CXF96_16510 [Stenotrophomonas sp. Betaine-02u-21]|uniref:hypothetical protein n=1 Tax=unclassified Stenotrophomonas TaxID=196198 RepID=UPI000C33490D|nr:MULTISPECIES: hypothetical protein [unclassified Stenotrophomonas]PKH70072.1 hypothetical protein CXF90_16335 [Stenotrophomonas sp. Betaine-02u-23]PKH71900.1 hypothetical protein CXF96_16510 [Stenotrophomonas sp. Betaine-02u-21]PKH96731.1 hypothetical protein CXG43_05595 [Stenotrophomonas sp. Bg11-02]